MQNKRVKIVIGYNDVQEAHNSRKEADGIVDYAGKELESSDGDVFYADFYGSHTLTGHGDFALGIGFGKIGGGHASVLASGQHDWQVLGPDAKWKTDPDLLFEQSYIEDENDKKSLA